jgi:hypothetical protein
LGTADVNGSGDAVQRGLIDGGVGKVVTVAVLVASIAAIIAGATIWLLLTDPVAVANAVETGEVSPLVRQLAAVLYDALIGLLGYF